jgi:hypothetical protein
MSIRLHKIQDEEKGPYTVFESPDIEFSDPIDHFAEIHIRVNYELDRKLYLSSFPEFPVEFINTISFKQAISEWLEKYNEYLKSEIPNNFISLLKSSSKKQQIHLLKGQSINPDQLVALIIKAHNDFGYSFSQYSVEFYHNGINKEDLPLVVELEGEKVNKVGETTLSDKQLRNAIKFRQVIVSKFIDNGPNWHCFFLTYRSIFGQENWHDGQPHLHYISDKFGLSRNKVVQEIKSRKYKLGNLPHIDFIGYRDKL